MWKLNSFFYYYKWASSDENTYSIDWVNMILVSCIVVSEDKLAMELHHVFKRNQIFSSKEIKRGKIRVVVLICLMLFYSFAYNVDIRSQQNQPKMWNKRTKWVLSQGLLLIRKVNVGKLKFLFNRNFNQNVYIRFKKINETVNINKIEIVVSFFA